MKYVLDKTHVYYVVRRYYHDEYPKQYERYNIK